MSGISTVTMQLLHFKNVLKGLFASWKTSVGELDKALKGFKAASEQSIKDAAKAKAAAAAKGAGGSASAKKKKKSGLMEILLDKGCQAVTFDSKGSDWNKANASATELFQSDTPVKSIDPYIVTGIDTSWAAAEDDTAAVGKSLKDAGIVCGVVYPQSGTWVLGLLEKFLRERYQSSVGVLGDSLNVGYPTGLSRTGSNLQYAVRPARDQKPFCWWDVV